MASTTIKFQLTSEKVEFEIDSIEAVEVTGSVLVTAEIVYSERGLHEIIYSVDASVVNFVNEDGSLGELNISSYEARIENDGILVPSIVEISAVDKTITIY